MNIMILVNKNFEYKGYTDGVISRENDTPNLECLGGNHFVDDNTHKRFIPSAEYVLKSKFGRHRIKEYCINYLFDKDDNSSNSEKKYDLLKQLFKMCIAEQWIPDRIISVSTSESTLVSQGGKEDDKTVNGCVFMGTQYFAMDCSQYDRDSKEQSHLFIDFPYMHMENDAIFEEFPILVEKLQEQLTAGMIQLPNYPAEKLFCNADSQNMSLGVINITKYENYEVADPAVYLGFKDSEYNTYIPEGLETTHAVVKLAASEIFGDEFPVLFVSPIVDRYTKFNIDVTDQQNHDGSFNAGVVVANMLENIRDYLPHKNNKEE